jgi:putative ABC transport system substrate-binding protein
MRRREFLGVLAGAATAWPLVGRAQQPAMPVIGFLSGTAPDPNSDRLRAFHQGLSEIGYVEGQNVRVEYRSAGNENGRWPELAADLVRRQVAVMVSAGGILAAQAAKAATTTIPIVFTTGVDPVAFGLIASLARPGGNLTGVSTLSVELAPKRLELLHELIPRATLIGVLVNPSNSNAQTISADLQSAARGLGVRIEVLHASTEREFDAAFATLTGLRASALVIGTDGFFIRQSERLAALTIRHAMPTMFQGREFAAAGGLMSYGGSLTSQYRQVGVYTGRILKGEKPADLPAQRSTKADLIINLKTVKALGLVVPLTLLGRADEVIE